MGTSDHTALQAASTIGQLLLKGHHYDEELTFDLYGDWTEEGGFSVEAVMIAGTQHNVTTLLSGKQLENLSFYLDLKDLKQPGDRQWANTYRCQSTRF